MRLESIIEELHNYQDSAVIDSINNIPILYTKAHTRPFPNKRKNLLAGLFIPLGFLLWCRIWFFRIRLHEDIGITEKQAKFITERINKRIQI
jgi:lipopolysaccharide export system permease protein